MNDFHELGAHTSCCLSFVLDCLSYSVKSKARKTGLNYTYVFVAPDGSMLKEISNYCEQGSLRPVIDKVFPFENCLDAMEYLESGHVTGKLVVEFIETTA